MKEIEEIGLYTKLVKKNKVSVICNNCENTYSYENTSDLKGEVLEFDIDQSKLEGFHNINIQFGYGG